MKIALFLKNNHQLWILLLAIFCSLGAQAQPFNQTISIPEVLRADKELAQSVSDMAFWLKQSTQKEYVIKEGGAEKEGIRLEMVAASNLPSSIKKQILKDGQSFYLIIDGTRSAQIIGTGANSFNNGIYTFLHILGFRWYMPGDAWTIIPTSLSPKLQVKKLYTPAFQGRFYAGTGGVNAIARTDPQNSFKKDYAIWNRRNRFGTDYAIKGHAGQAFYGANKKILDTHPEWFCNGKTNRFGRIDISHPEVVQVFIDWALSQAKPGAEFPTIGVDPSDGAGGKDDCLPSNMAEIKSWSDKYFWLANQVASRLDKADNRTQVQLYAYSNHAAPPSFKLAKNVYPIIIPYAFQKVATPNEFIKLWSDKVDGRSMGIYDYWNITQWSNGLPQFNIYSIQGKLRLWEKYNVTSINLETTNGKGAMGHTLWLASQMMWNTNLSFDSLYNDFLNQCFGPATKDVKRMYDRWSRNYQQEMEVNLSLQDLAAASSKTKDKAILERLNELKAYVHYLKLFYGYKAEPKSVDAYESLVNYIHSIHHLRVVQSSALLDIYIKPPSGYKKSTANKTLSALSTRNIEEQFKENLKDNATTYAIPEFTFDIKRTKPLINESAVTAKYLNGQNNYQFYLPEPKSFQIKAGSTKNTKLTITGNDQKVWVEKEILGSKESYMDIAVKLPAGIYNLSFGDFARFSRLTFPAGLVFISTGDISYYDNAGFPNHYAYIPKEASEIVYEAKPGSSGYWVNPDGKRVDPILLQNKIYRIAVPIEYRGKVWMLHMNHRSFKLLNIPNRFSLKPFEYKE